MKSFFKEHSLYLIVLTIVEIVLSVFSTISFVYTDSLSYADSLIIQSMGVEKLLQSMYSSTFWAFILVILALIAILSITTLVYKKLDYLFIGILLWVELFILSININQGIGNILATFALFIPIIIINIICYRKEKEKLNMKKKKTSK